MSSVRSATPVGSIQVTSKAFRPTPVPTSRLAKVHNASGNLSSRSATLLEKSDPKFASDFDESFLEEMEAAVVAVCGLLLLGNILTLSL
jgi:hypothetical protein